MNRIALFGALVAAAGLLGCGKPAAPVVAAGEAAGPSLELGGVALGRPLEGSPLAERLTKENPVVGPQGDSVGGSPILFSRVQLDPAKNVEILYLKFDEEDYERVKRAIGDRYALECTAGKFVDKRGREVDDELCVHTTPAGSVALRRRDRRADTSSAGLIAAKLGKPSLEDPFSIEDAPRQHKGT